MRWTGYCFVVWQSLHCGFRIPVVPLSKVLYHTCFVSGQRCKYWSRQPKLTSSVSSDVKPFTFTFLFQDFLPGLALIFTGRWHFGKVGLLPSGGFYSSTWAFNHRVNGRESSGLFCMRHTSLFVLSFYIYCGQREKSIAWQGGQDFLT